MNKFLKSNLSCSFPAHMPVYKMKSDTTKCRVVYLSNLADKTGFSQITTFRPRPPLEVAIYIYIYQRCLLWASVVDWDRAAKTNINFLSHNQVLLPGRNILLRCLFCCFFDQKLDVYDLKNSLI